MTNNHSYPSMPVSGNIFTGELVRLAAPLPEDHAIMAQWSNNAEYLRLLDGDPVRPETPEFFANFKSSDTSVHFHIRTLADDRMIGFLGLFNIKWPSQSAILGMAIGDPAYWNKSYGTDALRLMLQYAFDELNLFRVSLEVLSYNTRAIRLYEKCGFVREGVQRQAFKRDGRRWDVYNYAILADDYYALKAE